MERRKYFYDLHCHTTASLCGAGTLQSTIKMAKKRGLDGIAVTDHNTIYKGSDNIDGIDIIPGVEISVEKDKYHLLGYYIKENIERDRSFASTIDDIKKQSGFAVWAHPLRDDGDFDERMEEIFSLLDGLEVGNAMNFDKEREKISKKADNHSLLKTAGSDAHISGQVGMAVVVVSQRLNKDNFVEELKKGEVIIRPEIISFRERSIRWKIFMNISKRILNLRKKKFLKDIFIRVFLRNYLRINNIFLKRVKINYLCKKDFKRQ